MSKDLRRQVKDGVERKLQAEGSWEQEEREANRLALLQHRQWKKDERQAGAQGEASEANSKKSGEGHAGRRGQAGGL